METNNDKEQGGCKRPWGGDHLLTRRERGSGLKENTNGQPDARAEKESGGAVDQGSGKVRGRRRSAWGAAGITHEG